MMTDLRRPIEPADLEHKPLLVLTIASGSYKRLRNGDVFGVIVFREECRGSTVDLRLNDTDAATLRRIYGSLRESIGEFCVLEVRATAFMRDMKRNRVRVAYPATWRRVLPEVIPALALDGSAELADEPGPTSMEDV